MWAINPYFLILLIGGYSVKLANGKPKRQGFFISPFGVRSRKGERPRGNFPGEPWQWRRNDCILTHQDGTGPSKNNWYLPTTKEENFNREKWRGRRGRDGQREREREREFAKGQQSSRMNSSPDGKLIILFYFQRISNLGLYERLIYIRFRPIS